MKPQRIMAALTVAISTTLSAIAMPAHPELIKTTQPDGTQIEITLHGDENLNWIETADGYTLIHDSSDCLKFATRDAKGRLVPTDIVYRGTSQPAVAAGLAKGLRPTVGQNRMQQSKASSNIGNLFKNKFAKKGKQRLLMILVNFSDTKTEYTRNDFDNYMNQPDYMGIGSFRDYYLQQSYSQLDITTTVVDWVSVTHPKSYYRDNKTPQLIAEALEALDKQINFADFDNDGDGIVDGIAVIHQGRGQETTGSKNDIWSHSSELQGLEFDGVKIGPYTIQPEKLYEDRMSTIGVMCHEFCHNLGSPDYYDVDYDGMGGDFPSNGVWDLMASGPWNGNHGDQPASINPFQRTIFGWCHPKELTQTTAIEALQPRTLADDIYRIDTKMPGEYFLIENTQRAADGFSTALPGSGMLIYHINEPLIRESIDYNGLNISAAQSVYVVCSTAGCEPGNTPESYGDIDNALYTNVYGFDKFGDSTLPSSKSRNGQLSHFDITDIKQKNDGTISFVYTVNNRPGAPRNLQAQAIEGVLHLSWDAPDDSRKPTSYTIYSDGKVTNLALTTETDIKIPASRNKTDIGVAATYEDGSISDYACLAARVPTNSIKSIKSTTTDNGVKLQFALESYLTRSLGSAKTAQKHIDATEFEYGTLFKAIDLKLYQEGAITAVSFYNREITENTDYTACIWKITPQTPTPQLIAEQKIDNIRTHALCSGKFATPVTIEPDADYIFGVRCKSTNGLPIMLDIDGKSQGKYNLINISGQWTPIADSEGNMIIYAQIKNPTSEFAIPLTDDQPIENPDTDMLFPIGLKVYRNGIAIGTTGNSTFQDMALPDGTYTYTATTLYRSGNESAQSSKLTVKHSGIDNINVNTPTIKTTQNRLTIDNIGSNIRIYNTAGIEIFATEKTGTIEIELPQGIYIIDIDGRCQRTIIR